MKKFVAAVGRFRDRAIVKFYVAKNFLKEKQEGATLVEYALLVALIALVCIAAVAVLGTYLNGVFTNIKTKMSNNGVS
jgi:pilus assembly protein Flp/PilA